MKFIFDKTNYTGFYSMYYKDMAKDYYSMELLKTQLLEAGIVLKNNLCQVTKTFIFLVSLEKWKLFLKKPSQKTIAVFLFPINSTKNCSIHNVLSILYHSWKNIPLPEQRWKNAGCIVFGKLLNNEIWISQNKRQCI